MGQKIPIIIIDFLIVDSWTLKPRQRKRGTEPRSVRTLPALKEAGSDNVEFTRNRYNALNAFSDPGLRLSQTGIFFVPRIGPLNQTC